MSRDRKHIRLRGWDYSSEGIYFITICTQDRVNSFGHLLNGKTDLSEIGKIAMKFWLEIPDHFPHAKIDEFVIMPDHIHGILIMENVGSCHGMTPVNNNEKAGTRHGVSGHGMPLQDHMNQFSKPLKGSLSVIINQYKSSVTRWCNTHGHQFKWQSRFYDQILRDEGSLDSLRTYIRTNPLTWQTVVGKRSIRK